jgi:hypothetical protein
MFVPLRGWAVLPIGVIGLILFYRLRPPPVAGMRGVRMNGRVLAAGALGLIAATWLAARAMQTPLEFDGALYHFQAVRWINEARIMPGLGNLHGRLAFNSSFYPYVAALNFAPWFGHGRALANSFLAVLLVTQILWRLTQAKRAGGLGVLADASALPLIAYLMGSTLGLASPSADLASTLLQIAVVLSLIHGVEAWLGGDRDLTTRAAGLGLMAVTAVTLKLSNLGFAAGVWIVVAYGGWRMRAPAAVVRGSVTCGAALLAIFVARGYVLSGYPAYPSTVGRIDFNWAVEVGQARHDANTIYSWARQPWAPIDEVLRDQRWIRPWLWRARQNTEGIVAPVGVALLATAAALALGGGRGGREVFPNRWVPWLPVVPLVTGLAFWWCTAPDPRFANALIWLLPVVALVALAAAVRARWAWRLGGAMLVLVVVATNLHFVIWVARYAEKWGDISTTGWRPVLPAGYTDRMTDSGLVVHTYRYHPAELIWDGPRPATPEFNPRLRLRVPDQPDFGFMVK